MKYHMVEWYDERSVPVLDGYKVVDDEEFEDLKRRVGRWKSDRPDENLVFEWGHFEWSFGPDEIMSMFDCSQELSESDVGVLRRLCLMEGRHSGPFDYFDDFYEANVEESV